MSRQAPVGLRAEWVGADDVRRMEPNVTPEVRGALHYPDHAFVDNQRMAPLVAIAAQLAGAELRAFEGVASLALAGGRITGVLTTQGRQVAADAVVLAAGAWSSQLTPWRAGIIGPAKGEMISLQALPRPTERMVSYASTVVPRADGRMMIGATRKDGDHSREVTADAVALMLERGKRVIPSLAQAEFGLAWSGLRPLSADRLPVIGQDDVAGLFWATGHLGMGILSAPGTADAVAALVAARDPTIPLGPFSPKRFDAVVAR